MFLIVVNIIYFIAFETLIIVYGIVLTNEKYLEHSAIADEKRIKIMMEMNKQKELKKNKRIIERKMRKYEKAKQKAKTIGNEIISLQSDISNLE